VCMMLAESSLELMVLYCGIRLTMQARVGTGYSQSDIDKQDWPREACALTALRITAQPTNWKSVLKSAIQQVK
jgi:hypothetical protein